VSTASAAEATSIAAAPGAAATKPRTLLRRSLRYRRTRIGLVLTALLVLAAIAAPLFAPHDTAEFVGAPFAAPGSGAPLGTDHLGRDVLSRTLYGGRTVVWMSVSAATIGVALGLLIGLLAGYMRGLVDTVLMRGVDVLLAFPQVVLVLLFVALLGSKPWLIVALVALVWAPQVARVMRAVTMDVASREFVEAAEVLGQPRRRILIRDILPNLATPLLVEYGLRIAWSIAAIAAVGFLGFGIQPPTADWGLMINENRAGLVSQPWAVLAPIICIALFSIGTNLLAEGISRAVGGIDRVTGGYEA
jgi:peptide/nickel transport system permease protein